MRALLIDIEAAPAQAFIWALRDQYIPLQRIIDNGYVLCVAAQWLGEDEIHFTSVKKDGRAKMLRKVHKMISEADVVIHFNGTSYDMPMLNREFLTAGMTPPAPYKQIDLLKVARKRFRFLSNKMDYIAQILGLKRKVRHKGFELWVECMRGDETAWKEMEEYNIGDIHTLLAVYQKFLPWIQNHPNWGIFGRDLVCPNCGGKHFQFRGTATVKTRQYRRAQCLADGCGKWFRSSIPVEAKKQERFVEIAA